jgi:hypothetical protein
MSDFDPASVLTVENFVVVVNADQTVGVTVNFTVTGPSGTQYKGQLFLWAPQGQWPATGDLQTDLQTLAVMARRAAAATTGVA